MLLHSLLLFFLTITCALSATVNTEQSSDSIQQMNLILKKYKKHLDHGTYEGQDWSHFSKRPKSRYYTFKAAFEHFIHTNGKVIVELGTSRSFTHGGLPGCNVDDPKFWSPENPKNWDWGAGIFTLMAAESLFHTGASIRTVDLLANHIERCKIMTAPFSKALSYHVRSSVDFLLNCAPKSIDLLYLDTGDMTPLESTAQLQLEEAMIIIDRDLLSDNGIILIDDVRNQTPKEFGEATDLGKSKYSIPFFLTFGYEIVEDEYQVILRKAKKNEPPQTSQ